MYPLLPKLACQLTQSRDLLHAHTHTLWHTANYMGHAFDLKNPQNKKRACWALWASHKHPKQFGLGANKDFMHNLLEHSHKPVPWPKHVLNRMQSPQEDSNAISQSSGLQVQNGPLQMAQLC